ncbi:MAG TPA: ATP-dependent 6-phosphofructokinase [Polyangiaceae bacterium]
MAIDAAYSVMHLGNPTIPSTLRGRAWVRNDEWVLGEPQYSREHPLEPAKAFEKAGPREFLAFNPRKVRAAIVTCGGLCPGINNAVRSLYFELHHGYGVPEVLGFRYGFEGMAPDSGLQPVHFKPEHVRHIHRLGGSFLGTSRGRHDPAAMVSTLTRLSIDMLFAVGGNGTLQGAHAIHEELVRRGRHVAVVSLPKTIDDDIPYVDKTFGFETAVDMARTAIDAAHTEACGARNGIGIVKLMGRDAGFIAALATLASSEANFCLLPEFPFALEGEHGLLTAVQRRIENRGHAVIVVAEGCGAALYRTHEPRGLVERDASGNLSYASGGLDIGPRLRDALRDHFERARIPVTIKYIDPSYTIRAAPANGTDAVYCSELGRHAVHAAMAGRSDTVVGRYHGLYVHVPTALAVSHTRRVDPVLWNAVCEVTGQPPLVPPPELVPASVVPPAVGTSEP